jgi:putative ATPase
MSTLFAAAGLDKPAGPLADRLRPQRFEEVVGQEHLLAPDAPLGHMLQTRQFGSLILWGPPGCGKTTLARLLARESGYELQTVSAVNSGVAELKKIFDAARMVAQDGRRTMLFVDEIHRFNRAQQDAFLPVVEDGTVTLIGATTENPSFELNAALLSRCKLIVLRRLDDAALEKLLQRAEAHAGHALPLTAEAREALKNMADGDGRAMLNLAEEVLTYAGEAMDTATLASRLSRRAPVYDKHQESHYNLISALHKSVRGSDVQASLYWLSRMLVGGENPLYIARRLVRMAVEDIGLAEPQALAQCMAAQQAYDFLGSPEGELALAQAVIFLAMAPKSNAGYVAYKAALNDAKTHGSLMPPAHILNAPTKMMKELGYGAGYAYDPDEKDGFSGQNYFPEGMARQDYYRPVERGFEREMQKRLEYWDKLRQKRQEENA